MSAKKNNSVIDQINAHDTFLFMSITIYSDKLLNVHSELAQLRGHGGTRHTHLGRDVGPQAADVMLDLDGGRLLEPRGLGGHGDNKGLCL